MSSIVYARRCSGLRRPALLAFAAKLSRRVARGGVFQAMIAGDRELRDLNRRFRGKDEPTDVLSFPSADPSSLGDIAISYDRAKEQSRRFGLTVEAETRILMLHGVLHLTGMDHERDRGEMARAESRWRKKLELPSGLIERVRP